MGEINNVHFKCLARPWRWGIAVLGSDYTTSNADSVLTGNSGHFRKHREKHC